MLPRTTGGGWASSRLTTLAFRAIGCSRPALSPSQVAGIGRHCVQCYSQPSRPLLRFRGRPLSAVPGRRILVGTRTALSAACAPRLSRFSRCPAASCKADKAPGGPSPADGVWRLGRRCGRIGFGSSPPVRDAGSPFHLGPGHYAPHPRHLAANTPTGHVPGQSGGSPPPDAASSEPARSRGFPKTRRVTGGPAP